MEFNKLLLFPSRVRTTLIVYFQLIMKIFYRKLILMSQLSKPRRVDSWENSSECAQFLGEWIQFLPNRGVHFSAEAAWRVIASAREWGAGIFKSWMSLKTSAKDVQKRFMFLINSLSKVTLWQLAWVAHCPKEINHTSLLHLTMCITYRAALVQNWSDGKNNCQHEATYNNNTGVRSKVAWA